MLFLGGNTTDYVITDDSTPDMTAFTVCFWVKTYQKGNTQPFVSYATLQDANEILITDKNGLKLTIGGNWTSTLIKSVSQSVIK